MTVKQPWRWPWFTFFKQVLPWGRLCAVFLRKNENRNLLRSVWRGQKSLKRLRSRNTEGSRNPWVINYLENVNQGRKRNPNLNFWARIFSGGVGVFHTKGRGPKSSVCPLKPGKSNFFRGISRDFAGISRKPPKSLRKKVWVQFSFPTKNPPFFIRDAEMTIKIFFRGRIKRGVGRGFEKRVNRGLTLKFYCRPKAQEKLHFGKSHFYCHRFFPGNAVTIPFLRTTPSPLLWRAPSFCVCRGNLARNISLELRMFLRKMLRNFPRKFWAFLLWVRKNPAKFPLNFMPNFPAENQNEIHRRASAGAQAEFCWVPLPCKAPPREFQHPKCQLANVNWHPPKCKSVTSNHNCSEISPPQFTFWRLSICILEAEIVLGML